MVESRDGCIAEGFVLSKGGLVPLKVGLVFVASSASCWNKNVLSPAPAEVGHNLTEYTLDDLFDRLRTRKNDSERAMTVNYQRPERLEMLPFVQPNDKGGSRAPNLPSHPTQKSTPQ